MRKFFVALFLGFYFLFPADLSGIELQDDFLFSRITVDQGLSNNRVTCIYKDSRGFMWFGTQFGLNRYDGYSFKTLNHGFSDVSSLPDNRILDVFEGPHEKLWITMMSGFIIYDYTTEKFSEDSPVFHKKQSVPREEITTISKDSKDNLWFLTENSGVYAYLDKKEKFFHLSYDILNTDSISDIQTDSKGFAWLISNYGVLQKVDLESEQALERIHVFSNQENQARSWQIFIDSDDHLWIYDHNPVDGAFLYFPETGDLAHFHTGSAPFPLSSNIITCILQDDQGLIWIATDHGGINILDKSTFAVKHVQHNENDMRSLSHNSVISLYKDPEGIMWAGTFKRGLCFYHEQLYKFKLYKHSVQDPQSLPFDDVNCIQEDKDANLWLGTNGGGLIFFDRRKNTFSTLRHQPNFSNSLSNDVVVSMLYDSRDQLWIGTYLGGLNRYDGGRFYRYRHKDSDPASLGDDDVWHLYEDVHQNLWIGTLGSGLDKYDPNTNSFIHFGSGVGNTIQSDYILDITGDQKGNLWIGTADGLGYFEPKTGFKAFLHDPEDQSSISNNVINSIILDSRGLVWVGTNEGLNILKDTSGNGRFERYHNFDGLSGNSIQAILEDDFGDIWLSSNRGITRISLSEYKKGDKLNLQFINFNELDGLQGKVFNEGIAFKTRDGELIFAGSDGFNLIKPSELTFNENPPKIVITDIQIMNKSIRIHEEVNGRVILEKALIDTREIVLKHSEDILSLEFSALNFMHPEKNQYEYMLEGFNKSWIKASANERRVTYTNLDPGEYTFRVRASNNDGVWNETGISLRIIVKPPFWRTRTALVMYIILLIAILLLLWRLILQRERRKFRIEQGQLEAQRRHEMDLLKIRFFTNVSHEFRTPLSLIISPLERMLKSPGEGDQQYLKLIYRNARRLLNLVNQLLDFRRMEVQKIDLKPSYGDIINFIDEIYLSFSDLADQKTISFKQESSHKSFFAHFDHDKLEKIIFNLLSNAFKFTPEGKTITVGIKLLDTQHQLLPEVQDDKADSLISIQVSDTGLGIPKENLDKVFDRFFQADDAGNVVSQGSGIGLSLTKDFVDLHKGTIEVESELHKGTTFTVLIPLTVPEENVETPENIPSASNVAQNDKVQTVEEETLSSRVKATILLVEDNDDFRFYLKDNLQADYDIIEAPNGRIGLETAGTQLPDLVVSDVMMPEMDGFELCNKLKSDATTSHIPVILLTARMAAQKKVEGFETGADDYITKPFSFELLASRIANLIAQRQRIKDTFQKQFKIEPGEITITSLDEKLLSKALKLVEENMSNSEFTVEKLSRELGMSRVHLYKKLTALTGKTPIEFIRIMRLKRAAQLLEKSQLTVAEVAYEVGFNDPRYFSRYFRSEFGMLPTQYINSKKGKG